MRDAMLNGCTVIQRWLRSCVCRWSLDQEGLRMLERSDCSDAVKQRTIRTTDQWLVMTVMLSGLLAHAIESNKMCLQ